MAFTTGKGAAGLQQQLFLDLLKERQNFESAIYTKNNFIKVKKHLRLRDLWKRHLTIFQFDEVLEPGTEYFIRQMLQL